MQRYFIIGAGAIVVIGVAVVAYLYFFTGNAPLAVAPAGSTSLPAAGSNGSSANAGKGGGNSAVITGMPAAPTKVTPRLVQVDKGPVVAGEVAIDVNVLPDGTIATSTPSTRSGQASSASTTPDVEIEYLERESGNIFSYLVDAGALTRISNKTLPGIEEAAWLPDGSAAFVRYLSGNDYSTINTYALPATGQGGFFLPQDLAGVATARASTAGAPAVFTIASGANGSLATTLAADGSRSKTAFSSPLSMLRGSFLGKGSYLAFTKPSTALDGYAYSVDAAGDFSRAAGPLPGLVALASPLGTYVLVSYAANGTMSMELVNVKTLAVTPLPVATIADKCAWSLDETAVYCGIPTDPSASFAYPDDWYQGAAHFSDRIWKIDVHARLAELTLDFGRQAGAALDATALAIDPQSKVLTFVNKNDGSLWSYQL